jgi:uncharacterized protein
VKLLGRRAHSSALVRRIFFATDLHGSNVAFRKLLNASQAYKVDALICGGDLAGKRLFPLIDQGDTSYLTQARGHSEIFTGEDGLAQARRFVESQGGYHITVSADEAETLNHDPARLERLFVEKVQERLRSWVSLANERLGDTSVRCYFTGGNDDSEEMLAPLGEVNGDSSVVACEGRVVDVIGYPMVSLGWSNQTPWKTPRETTEDDLRRMIEEAANDLDDPARAIFNFHVPPKDSTLDTCPELDLSTWPPAPVIRGGHQMMIGAGSSAVADAIRERQPLLTLHGHIHESTAVVTIGRTTCVNPGSDYQDGTLRGVIISLRDDEVVGYQLTQG